MEEIASAEARRDELLRGARLPRRKGIDTLAAELGLEQWYWRVYRRACQPAHLGDVVDFMPTDERGIRVGAPPSAAANGAVGAVHFGIALMLVLFEDINKVNTLGLRTPLDEFKARYKAITEAAGPTDYEEERP